MTAHQVSHVLPFGPHSCFHAFLCHPNPQNLIQQEGERAKAVLSTALLRQACPHTRHTHPALLKICLKKKQNNPLCVQSQAAHPATAPSCSRAKLQMHHFGVWCC